MLLRNNRDTVKEWLLLVTFSPYKSSTPGNNIGVAKHEWSLWYDVQLWLVSYARKTGCKCPLWQVLSFESWLYAQLTGFTMLLSLQNSVASLHTTPFKTNVMSKSGDNIGLYMRKKCQFEDVPIIPLYYCITCPGHPCLVTLLFMASLYSTLFLFEECFIYLSPFLFTACTCIGE